MPKKLKRKREEENDNDDLDDLPINQVAEIVNSREKEKEESSTPPPQKKKSKRSHRPEGLSEYWQWFMDWCSAPEMCMIAGFFSQVRTKSAMKSKEVKQQWINAKESIVEAGLSNELTVLLEALFQKKDDEHNKLVTNWKKVNIFLGLDYQLLRRFATADRLFYYHNWINRMEWPDIDNLPPATVARLRGLQSCTDHHFDMEYTSFNCHATLTVDNTAHKLRHDRFNLGRKENRVAKWNPVTYPSEDMRIYAMESVIHMRLRQSRPDTFLIPDLWFIIVDYCVVFK